jgi:hypothetical protein
MCDKCADDEIWGVLCPNCEGQFDPDCSKAKYFKELANIFCCNDCEVAFKKEHEAEDQLDCEKCGNALHGGDNNKMGKSHGDYETLCDMCYDEEDKNEEKPREDEQTCDECGDCGDFILHKSKVKEDHFVCCICKKAEDEEQICKKLEALGVKVEYKDVGSLMVRCYTYPATEPSKEIDELIKQLE